MTHPHPAPLDQEHEQDQDQAPERDQPGADLEPLSVQVGFRIPFDAADTVDFISSDRRRRATGWDIWPPA